jgi:hypothetical protein
MNDGRSFYIKTGTVSKQKEVTCRQTGKIDKVTGRSALRAVIKQKKNVLRGQTGKIDKVRKMFPAGKTAEETW